MHALSKDEAESHGCPGRAGEQTISSAFDGIVVAILLLFFSNLPIYGAFFWWPIQPMHAIAALASLVVVVLVLATSARVPIRSPMLIWIALYVSTCLVYYAVLSGGDDEPLRKRLIGMLFLSSMFVLLVQSQRAMRWSQYGVVAAVVFACAANVYDLLHPFSFVPATHEFANPGRGAGFYVNANQSAAAIVAGALVSVGAIRAQYRMPFLLVAFVGVLATLSRGAIAGFSVAVLLLWFAKSIRLRQIIAGGSIFLLAAFVAWRLLGLPIDLLDGEFLVYVDRMRTLVDGYGGDFSIAERAQAADAAIRLIASHPFWGAGLGVTELWSLRASTHNMFLTLAADFGVWGALFFVAFVWIVVSGGRWPLRRVDLPLLAFLMIWALVDHGFFVSYYLLAVLALASAISYRRSLDSCHG